MKNQKPAPFEIVSVDQLPAKKPAPGGRVSEQYKTIIETAHRLTPGNAFPVPFDTNAAPTIGKYLSHVRAAVKAKRLNGSLKHISVSLSEKYPDMLRVAYESKKEAK
jgi:hypothetical protein